MDKYSKDVRSYMMSSVKSKDTKIEKSFSKILWQEGIRYRKSKKTLLGKPDFSIQKYRIVIFIDSCFWHGCEEHCRMPKSNKAFWTKKIKRNIERDKEVTDYYKKNSWNIIRLWEHDLQDQKKLYGIIKKLKKVINEAK